MWRAAKTIRGAFLSLTLFLAACGGGGSNSTDFGSGASPQQAVSGTHASGWLPGGHKPEANLNPNACADCHGNDFLGGTTGVACTKCHLGNQASVHPLLWGNFAYALHGRYSALNGNTSCANVNCHGSNLSGVPGSGPSCTQCHMGGVNSFHPVAWKSNIILHKDYVGSNGTSSCRTAVCHGTSLKGVFLSGPSCGSCHPWAG